MATSEIQAHRSRALSQAAMPAAWQNAQSSPLPSSPSRDTISHCEKVPCCLVKLIVSLVSFVKWFIYCCRKPRPQHSPEESQIENISSSNSIGASSLPSAPPRRNQYVFSSTNIGFEPMRTSTTFHIIRPEIAIPSIDPISICYPDRTSPDRTDSDGTGSDRTGPDEMGFVATLLGAFSEESFEGRVQREVIRQLIAKLEIYQFQESSRPTILREISVLIHQMPPQVLQQFKAKIDELFSETFRGIRCAQDLYQDQLFIFRSEDESSCQGDVGEILAKIKNIKIAKSNELIDAISFRAKALCGLIFARGHEESIATLQIAELLTQLKCKLEDAEFYRQGFHEPLRLQIRQYVDSAEANVLKGRIAGSLHAMMEMIPQEQGEIRAALSDFQDDAEALTLVAEVLLLTRKAQEIDRSWDAYGASLFARLPN